MVVNCLGYEYNLNSLCGLLRAYFQRGTKTLSVMNDLDRPEQACKDARLLNICMLQDYPWRK